MVIFPDKKVELFSSLRKIQEAICIDSSTISKKLKEKPLIILKPKEVILFFLYKVNID